MMILRRGLVVTAALIALAVLCTGAPALAGTAANVSVRLFGTWPNACAPVPMNPPAVIVGPTLVEVRTSSATAGCAPVATPFDWQVPVPITTDAPWTVVWYHYPDGNPPPLWIGAFAFDATPCPFRPERGGMECGPDLGGTGRTALNLTGKAGPAGGTWIALYDEFPDDGAADVYGSVTLDADLLISTYNNAKGVGLLALYNRGKKGLALIMFNNGNTDSLVLGTVDGTTGKFVPLLYPGTAKPAAVSLCRVQRSAGGCGAGDAAIFEDQWYHLTARVTVTGSSFKVDGVTVHRVSDGREVFQVPGPLTYEAARPAGLDPTGEVGAIGSAFSAAVDSSVESFVVTPE